MTPQSAANSQAQTQSDRRISASGQPQSSAAAPSLQAQHRLSASSSLASVPFTSATSSVVQVDQPSTTQLEAHHIVELDAQKRLNESSTAKVTTTLQSLMAKLASENARLAFVKQELSKLDASLGDNIALLRTEIEQVGRSCSQAQSRFDVIEKEYLSARHALANLKQKKVLLTSHLDFIILSNEKTKAAKLKELELQLGIAESSGNQSLDASSSSGAAAPNHNSAPSFSGFGEDEVAKFKI